MMNPVLLLRLNQLIKPLQMSHPSATLATGDFTHVLLRDLVPMRRWLLSAWKSSPLAFFLASSGEKTMSLVRTNDRTGPR